MLTQPLRQTAEYQSLLAAVAGPVPAAAALFGLPPTARAQVLAGAPQQADGCFVVPQGALGEEEQA